MKMAAVDRRLYIGSEGRPIYDAGLFGGDPYYIPTDDVAALDRRRTAAAVAAYLPVLAAFAGSTEGFFDTRWYLLLVPIVVAPSILVGRWVRSRYQPVSDLHVRRAVRRVAVINGPTLGSALALSLLLLPSWIFHTLDRHTLSLLGSGLTGLALVCLESMSRRRAKRAADAVVGDPERV